MLNNDDLFLRHFSANVIVIFGAAQHGFKVNTPIRDTVTVQTVSRCCIRHYSNNGNCSSCYYFWFPKI